MSRLHVGSCAQARRPLGVRVGHVGVPVCCGGPLPQVGPCGHVVV